MDRTCAKDFDGFLNRLPALLAIYKDRGYDFRQDIYDVTIQVVPEEQEGKAKVFFLTFDNTEVHYTLDGSEPNAQSPLYTIHCTWTRMQLFRQ